METNVELLQAYLSEGLIKEKQAELFVNLLNGNLADCKGDRMRFIYSKEQLSKIDSAVPLPLTNKVYEVFKSDAAPEMIMDYNTNKLGALVNVDRIFIKELFDRFRP